MISNLPPPGGVPPHHHHHHHVHGQAHVGLLATPPSLESPGLHATPSSQDSFSHFEDFKDDFQNPHVQGFPPQSAGHPQYQYYPHQYTQQYPGIPPHSSAAPPPPGPPPSAAQQPHWHHQHGYYNAYPQQPQTYPNYSPSDPSSYPHGYPNGYYEQHANGVGGGQGGQNAPNCTPSPIANSDDSGGDCVNESKALKESITAMRNGIIPLIPRPKGPRPTTSVMSAKRGGKRARQRDPNEPQKPVSAYALFFRDVQAGIKQRNPAATFGEVSKHVAAMWDAMEPDSKAAYKRRTEQAKKEYLRQLASYRATLVSKGNTLESPYNGNGLVDVTKVGEDRSYLMKPRMSESSGYGSNSSGSSSVLTPLGSGPNSAASTTSSPQSAMGQSPNNGYHLSNQHHLRQQHPAHMPPESRFPSGYPPAQGSNDPYSQQHPDHESVLSGGPGGPQPGVPGPGAPGGQAGGQQVMMSSCKRGGCPNPVRMMSNSGRPMPEYCSNDCLVEDNNKQMTNNPYANATTNWPPASGPPPQQAPQPEQQTPGSGGPQGPTQQQGALSPNSNPTNTDDK